MMKLFERPEDWESVEADCWRLLLHAVDDNDCGWRLPVLATVDNGACRQRIVVLRSADVATRTILAHTDIRSAKVSALKNGATASWLFYDASLKVQMQFVGHTQIHHHDQLSQQLWDHQPLSSLRGYLAPLPPGTRCETAAVNLPTNVRDRVPDANELATAKQNFAAISCVASSIEWLLLRPSGNLRLKVRYDADGSRTIDWLAP